MRFPAGRVHPEALAVEASHRVDADGVVATVERLVAGRATPAHLRMDNGSELISAASRDWYPIWAPTPPTEQETMTRDSTPEPAQYSGKFRHTTQMVEVLGRNRRRIAAEASTNTLSSSVRATVGSLKQQPQGSR